MGEPTMVSRRVVLSLPTGAGESVSRIKPYLQEFIGPSVVDLSGEEPASGSLLKLLGNVVILTTMETVAEANVFAEKAGVGAENMGKFMDTLFPRPPHTVYNQRMLSGGYHKSQVLYSYPSFIFHQLILPHSSPW
jgi:3-hydroxyisobutyrate dehydrogenase-like beta-hydroxyacid dehydrogenase